MSTPDAAPPTETRTIRRVVVVVLVAILVLWAATLPVLGWIVKDDAPSAASDAVARRGQIGDAFGAINALFSGLALAGVIVAILLQREELRLQRKELEETREQVRRQAEAAETGVADQSRRTLHSDIRAAVAAYRDLQAKWIELSELSVKADESSRGIRVSGKPARDSRFKELRASIEAQIPQLHLIDVTCTYLDLDVERSGLRGALVTSLESMAREAGLIPQEDFLRLVSLAESARSAFDKHVIELRRMLPILPPSKSPPPTSPSGSQHCNP